MADIKIAGRIKAGAADGISGYASEILFDDAASNKTVKEKIEEAASSPQTMIVTITPDGNDGYEADKTFAEIKAFIDNGGTVIAKDEEDGDSYYYLDNYIASEVVFTRNIWGSGGFSTRYYTIDNTNTVSFIDSVHHISSAVDSSSTANLANSAAVKAVKDEVDTKQNALTFDNVPTANSSNPVKSGGVYQAIQSIDVSSQISGKADKSEMSVVAGTGANADKTTITLKSGTSATVLTQHQDVSGKADSADVYTKPQVDEMIDDAVHWGDTVGNVTTADFNAQTDTVWNKAQVLSSAQKQQARENIGAAGINDVVGMQVISHGTSDTTFALTPNKFHVWGEVASLTLTFAAGEVGYVQEYLFQFTSGSTATTINLPSSVRWITDNTVEANKTYQVSILNSLAVMGGA